MAMITVAAALAPATDGIVFAVITNPPTGATRGEPRTLRKVTAVRMTVALALCGRMENKSRETWVTGDS